MPTQKELARVAGVSSGTVSNVISGAATVSPRAREKVMDAIRALGYQPNLIARSLRMNRTHTLGMVVPDLTVPFFLKVIRGAESAARERGYFLIVLDAENSMERQADILSLLQAQRVEGIVLIASAEGEEEGDSNLVLPTLPTVCLDRLPRHLNTDSVRVKDRAAAALGIDHLLARGHKRIAVATGPMSLHNERERLRGCREALRKANLDLDDSLVWTTGFQDEEAAQLFSGKLTSMEKRPTAIFATNGVTGLGVLRGAYQVGLKTPRDFAFVTFDEITSELFFEPAVTSVVQPAFDIGRRGVNVLLGRIEGTDTSEPNSIRLDASLVIRDSSIARSPES